MSKKAEKAVGFLATIQEDNERTTSNVIILIQDTYVMSPNNVCDMWAQLPNEIWERILDDVDSRGLESAQEACVAWRNIVIAYTLNGRLLNRAKVSYLTMNYQIITT